MPVLHASTAVNNCLKEALHEGRSNYQIFSSNSDSGISEIIFSKGSYRTLFNNAFLNLFLKYRLEKLSFVYRDIILV